MFSKLSKGVNGARDYDQAARTIACMINTLAVKGMKPNEVPKDFKIGFSVVAPKSPIDAGHFRQKMNPESIKTKVLSRIEQFDGKSHELLENWRENYFDPWMQYLSDKNLIKVLTWEEIIESVDCTQEKSMLKWFYEKCLEFGNKSVSGKVAALKRGQKCKADSYGDAVLVVTNSGSSNSRVFRSESREVSFKIPTRDLKPIENESLADVPEPKLGTRWKYYDSTVEIVSSGPARSNAKTLEDGRELLVENHLLEGVN